MFDIHTDVSVFQVGLVISQLHRLIEFYRHTSTGIHMRYGLVPDDYVHMVTNSAVPSRNV